MAPTRPHVFRPSLVVNLLLTFDEAFHVRDNDIPAPTTDNAGDSAVQTTTRPAAKPLILQGASSNLSIVSNRIPRQGSIELPGFRQAGKFNFSFDYSDLPIDPRLVRACGVEVYLGTVRDDDFGRGMVQTIGTDNFGRPMAQRASVLVPSDANRVLAGVVDTWAIEHGENGSVIEMEGRDLRGILLDSPIQPKQLAKLDLTKSIGNVVNQIVKMHPFGSRVEVLTNHQDWPDGVEPSPASRDGLTRVRLKAAGDGKGQSSPPGGGAGGDGSLNYWDIITQYCFLVGAVPYFNGHTLEVRAVRSIFDLQKAGIDPQKFPTPFAGGRQREVEVDADPVRTEKLSVRRLVYGRDVWKLKFERKYTGSKARVVECVSIDSSQKGKEKLLVARWPDVAVGKGGQPASLATVQTAAERAAVSRSGAAQTTSVAPSGAVSDTEVIRIPVPGIKDIKRLRTVAQAVFEEVGRGEMGGAAESKDLASFGGDNDDPDLLKLRPGDGVEFLVDARHLSSRSPLVSELTAHQPGRRSFEEEVSAIQKRLGDPNVARVLVATARNAVAELINFFRVANVKYDWNKDSGVGVAFDFENYIVTRADATGSLGPNTANPTRHSADRAPVGAKTDRFGRAKGGG